MQSAEILLKDIVETLLSLSGKWLTETDQFKLLSALQTNQKNLEHAAIEAKKSAAKAEEMKRRLEIESATKKALEGDFAVATSKHRSTTASFATLEQVKQKKIASHKIALLQLAQKLSVDLDKEKTPTSVIEKDILDMNAYIKKHSIEFDLEDFTHEKNEISDIVTRARHILDKRKRHETNARLAWSGKQKQITEVSNLLNNLQDAVDDEEPDEVEEIAKKLNNLNFTKVYRPRKDALMLFNQASDLVGYDVI